MNFLDAEGPLFVVIFRLVRHVRVALFDVRQGVNESVDEELVLCVGSDFGDCLLVDTEFLFLHHTVVAFD